MILAAPHARRRGTVVPYLALTIAALLGFLALAIDVAMLATAKAQVQNAADLAVLTAMRTVNGDPTASYNQANATTNAQNILTYNNILGQQIQSSQLALSYGSYDYDQTSQTFKANFPPTTGRPLSAASATVTTTGMRGAFSTVFGIQFLPNLSASAQAVHRPRDVALVFDLSGSMRMGTCLGFDFYTSSRTSNNPDTLVPTFGHYSAANANMQGPTSAQTSGYDNYTISPSNTTAPNSSYTLTYVNNFYQNAAYTTPLVRAFDSYSSTDGGTTWTAPTSNHPQLPPTTYASAPGGDVPLFKSGSTTTYATSVSDVLGSSTTNGIWELDGYSAYSAGKPDTSGTGSVPAVWTQVDYSNQPFHGYTQGPGYYGETMFLWPPDPRNANTLSGSTLTSYLNLLGVTNTTDQATLSAIWSTWQGQGVGPGSTGLANLQNWLKGTAKGGAGSLPQDNSGGSYYGPTSNKFVPNITTWNGVTLTSANQPRTYYAVCRLFNRAYPQGSSWSGSTLTTGAFFHADWRLQYFGTNDNTVLFNGSGSLNTPGSGTYTINYGALLGWIAAAPDPFPAQLRAGRIKYYGSVPSSITGSWPGYGSTDQRFWKEVIDYTLGFYQTSSSNYQDVSAMAGYGSDFTWGTKVGRSLKCWTQTVMRLSDMTTPV
jgi:hypothetical protein